MPLKPVSEERKKVLEDNILYANQKMLLYERMIINCQYELENGEFYLTKEQISDMFKKAKEDKIWLDSVIDDE